MLALAGATDTPEIAGATAFIELREEALSKFGTFGQFRMLYRGATRRSTGRCGLVRTEMDASGAP